MAMRWLTAGAFLAFAFGAPAATGEVKVLTAGAMREVILMVLPQFSRRPAISTAVDDGTAGALVRRISDGEAMDVVVVPRPRLGDLARTGRPRATRAPTSRGWGWAWW